MRKRWISRVAWMLIMAMVLSCMPVDSIYASEVTEPVIEQESESAKEQESEESVDLEEMFKYLLINQPELQAGEEQTVVISLGEGSENVAAMELYVKDEAGNVYTLQSAKNEEGIFVFQKTFAKGVYYIDSVKLTIDGEETVYVMSDMEINAVFSVGKDCPEEEKSEHIEVEGIQTEDVQVETSVVTVNEDGTTEETTIEEALAEATASYSTKARTLNSARTVQDNVVVVLDPGHDSQHQGAYYHGIKEHEPTLKIAKYCKEELETYGGVTVYLTRETEKCPYPGSSNNIDDIQKRVKDAAAKGADAYVSIHLNASSSSSPKGAEVYYHSKSAAGKKLSQQVQDELVELGLQDREIKNNDAYAVTKTAYNYGFPGIIIEHAFLSNKSDVDNYLKSEASLKKLGIADATGIAEHFNLPKIGTKVAMAEAAYTVTNALVPEQILSEMEGAPAFAVSEQLASQRFELIGAGDKCYYISAEDTGKVLSIANGTVQMAAKNTSSADQKWYFLESGADYYYLRSASGKYLAVREMAEPENGIPEFELVVSDVADETTQQWKLSKASYRPIEGFTPKLVSAANSGTSVVVKWKELTGAEGYKVYRRTSGGSWSLLATVAGETTTTFTDSKVAAATAYAYTVQAYKGATVSAYNQQGVSVTTPAKKTYTKYKTTTSVNYRTGAGTSYSKGGTFAKGKVVEVENGYSKKANGLTWYRVKINSKEYYIAAKYLSKVITLAKPTLVSAKYSGSTVTFKWKKVSNAKGYYVYRKVKGGKWSKIATVKSGSTVQYKDKKAKKGKTYLYTVRAYNGSYTSGYYDGVSVKTSKETLVKYKTKSKVHYRAGAGTKYKKKGTLKKGKTVYVVKGWSKKANKLTWYKIKISGKYYYVASKYLKKK